MSGRYSYNYNDANAVDSLAKVAQHEKSIFDDLLYGIYYCKDRIVIVIPAGWFVRWFMELIKAFIICKLILGVWATFTYIFCPDRVFVQDMMSMMVAILTYIALRVILYLQSWYNATFNPITLTKLPFLLFVGSIVFASGILYNLYSTSFNYNMLKQHAAQLMDHEMWLTNLDVAVHAVSKQVTEVDNKFTTITRNLDGKYTALLEKENSAMAKIDDGFSKMWEGFGLISVTRQRFGLGCFVNGTLIQTDEFGSVKKIEELNESDMIFNPDLKQSMKMKVIINGPENGMIYEMITSDSLKVSVTEKHPMKICQYDVDERILVQCENIAAVNVYEGNWTQTIHGFQQIMKINQIAVNDVEVYNIMLDMHPDESIIVERTIIANGVHTFDLYAQAMHS